MEEHKLPPEFRVLWFAFLNTQIIFGVFIYVMASNFHSDTPNAIAPLIDFFSAGAGLAWVSGFLVPRWAPKLLAKSPPGDTPNPLKRAYFPFILQVILFEISGIIGMVIGLLHSVEMGLGLVAAALLGVGLSYPTLPRIKRLAGL